MRWSFAAMCVAWWIWAPNAVADVEPWKIGVTDEQRATAQARLDEGNALFYERRYPEALVKYEAALAAWNHPALRFNVVRCLIQLERPVEAAENLERTLVYGAAPLEDVVYREALEYQKLLANQIGHLAIACTQAGVRVSLDGAALAVACPGQIEQRVRPGPHQIVGVKDGFLTETTDVKVVGGSREVATIELRAVGSATRVVNRWSTWKPWVVFGGGLAVLGAGTGLQLIASSDLDTFDRQIALSCSRIACDPVVNPEIARLADDRDRALLRNRVAIGMIALGAGTAITGVVLLYLNRAHTIQEPAVGMTFGNGGATVSIGGTL